MAGMGMVGMLLALASTCLTVQEDSILSPERHGPAAAPVQEAVAWSIDLRMSKLGGDFDSGESTKWDEIFQDGVGVGFDLAWWMPAHPKILVGPYFSATFDVFQGREITLDPTLPETVSFDDLLTMRFVLGVGAREHVERFFFEQRVGVGMGYFMDSEFDYNVPGLNVSGDLIEATM